MVDTVTILMPLNPTVQGFVSNQTQHLKEMKSSDSWILSSSDSYKYSGLVLNFYIKIRIKVWNKPIKRLTIKLLKSIGRLRSWLPQIPTNLAAGIHNLTQALNGQQINK